MDPLSHGRAGKNRPAVVVSQNGRNQHLRADTVLVVPLSTSVQKLGPWHLLLRAGETGLREDSVAWAENISAVGKDQLLEQVAGHRPLTNTQICRLAGPCPCGYGVRGVGPEATPPNRTLTGDSTKRHHWAMRLLWCWRCKCEMPMLDEVEYAHVSRLYRESMKATKEFRERWGFR